MSAVVDSALAERIERHLSVAANTAVRVRALAPLGGGACQDNYRVDLFFAEGTLAGERRMALRSDARKPLPGSISRQQEFAVMEAAVGAKVTTPAPKWLTQGLVRDGAWAYFMEWIDGEAVGRRVVRNPELADARQRLPEQLAASLARIHSITPKTHPDLPAHGLKLKGEGHDAVFAAMREQLEELPEPHPVLELCLHWLREHRPAEVEPTLVHGDFRTGNFMVRPEGLAAILDWEFAHFGDPMEDLAWVCVRDWRFNQLALPVGGFSRREPFYEAYQRESGKSVDPKRVLFWEVLGNLRWAAGSVYQGERYLSGEESDLELIAIARRSVEMEWEALRLIEEAG